MNVTCEVDQDSQLCGVHSDDISDGKHKNLAIANLPSLCGARDYAHHSVHLCPEQRAHLRDDLAILLKHIARHSH